MTVPSKRQVNLARLRYLITNADAIRRDLETSDDLPTDAVEAVEALIYGGFAASMRVLLDRAVERFLIERVSPNLSDAEAEEIAKKWLRKELTRRTNQAHRTSRVAAPSKPEFGTDIVRHMAVRAVEYSSNRQKNDDKRALRTLLNDLIREVEDLMSDRVWCWRHDLRINKKLDNE